MITSFFMLAMSVAMLAQVLLIRGLRKRVERLERAREQEDGTLPLPETRMHDLGER